MLSNIVIYLKGVETNHLSQDYLATTMGTMLDQVYAKYLFGSFQGRFVCKHPHPLFFTIS